MYKIKYLKKVFNIFIPTSTVSGIPGKPRTKPVSEAKSTSDTEPRDYG